jgi:serine/threonine protein kinase
MLFELSRLHPAIVRAFDTGCIWAGDAPARYLSLEWLDGVSLDRELRKRRQSGLAAFQLAEVLALLEGPAAGLARAHARGIVHCDIKPENLFIDTGGQEPQIKILDFGIAKLMDDTEAVAAEPDSEAVGTASFTPMYAAPEQWSKRLGDTGPWTDVHGLSLVCTELLSGRRRFTGMESTQFRAACLEANVRPTPASLGVDLSAAVEAVFLRAVALDPRHRYPDVGAFWRALCGAAEWSPSCTSPAIGALSEEADPEGRFSDGDVPASSLSVPFANATSVTSSRAASGTSHLAARARRLAGF